MTILEQIIYQIENLSSSDLISLNNTYCRENSYDDEIYDNDEDFFNTYFENKVLEAVRSVSHGEYNYTDNYVKFNGYGNLQTFNSIDTSDLVESIPVIAEYAFKNQSEFDMLDFDIEYEDEED